MSDRKEKPRELSRMQAIVTGRVQGVGYRAWVHRIASGLGLTGYVKNRLDGAVEAEAQGDPEAVERFFHVLNIGPAAAHIKEVRAAPIPIVPNENDFQIQ